jgi:hypothetical protein
MMHADSTAKMFGEFVQWFKNSPGDAEIESQDASCDYADQDNHAQSFLDDLLAVGPGDFAGLGERFHSELYSSGNGLDYAGNETGTFSLVAHYFSCRVFAWTVSVHVYSLCWKKIAS